jgi:hypothetical protein
MNTARNHLLTLVAGAGMIATDVTLRASLGLIALGIWWPLLLVLGIACVVLAIGWWGVDLVRWALRKPWRGWTLRSPVALSPPPVSESQPVLISASRQPAFRTPTVPRVPRPAVAAHIVITGGTPETAVVRQGMLPPSVPEGDLPIRVDMDGFAGERRGQQRADPWIWKANDVHLINGSDEVLEFRVWLLSETAKFKYRQRHPGRLRLEPHQNLNAAFEFVQQTHNWTDDERASPPDTVVRFELVLLEIGTSRELRMRFTPVHMRKPEEVKGAP